MINFIQSNQDIVKNQSENDANLYIIDNDIWENLIYNLSKREKLENICAYVHSISIKYNIDKKNIIKKFISYLIKQKITTIPLEKFDIIEELFHNNDIPQDIYLHYFIYQFLEFL